MAVNAIFKNVIDGVTSWITRVISKFTSSSWLIDRPFYEIDRKDAELKITKAKVNNYIVEEYDDLIIPDIKLINTQRYTTKKNNNTVKTIRGRKSTARKTPRVRQLYNQWE